MRSDWISKTTMCHLLAGLMPENRLALELSMRYGLRIGDVLSLYSEDVRKGRFSIKEEKTGKRRYITLSKSVQDTLLKQAGKIYVFEHRLDYKSHRTRQAVYKDLKRIAKAFRLKLQISPHTARKIYAVDMFHSGGLKKVQKLLNHSDEAVTILYALADELTARNRH